MRQVESPRPERMEPTEVIALHYVILQARSPLATFQFTVTEVFLYSVTTNVYDFVLKIYFVVLSHKILKKSATVCANHLIQINIMKYYCSK